MSLQKDLSSVLSLTSAEVHIEAGEVLDVSEHGLRDR
jgi:hypothetical protein